VIIVFVSCKLSSDRESVLPLKFGESRVVGEWVERADFGEVFDLIRSWEIAPW
jgi:hypothetical protein